MRYDNENIDHILNRRDYQRHVLESENMVEGGKDSIRKGPDELLWPTLDK